MSTNIRDMYLELIKKCLIGMIDEDPPYQIFIENHDIKSDKYIRVFREYGRDFPSTALSAIGLKRMDNLQFCIEQVIADNILGDLIETGVWRGGATIFMRAILKAYEVNDRNVWAADSFEGLPDPDIEQYPSDAKWKINIGKLAVSIEKVQENFTRYGLLDQHVHFLKGWFKDTLPTAPIDHLSVLRMDGDLYQSTIESLTYLYPKLSIGGYAIIDDYILPACRQAVTDYREQNNINDEICDVDGWCVYWRREQ